MAAKRARSDRVEEVEQPQIKSKECVEWRFLRQVQRFSGSLEEGSLHK